MTAASGVSPIETDIEGRAMVIYLSLGREGSNLLPIRWDRFGKVLD